MNQQGLGLDCGTSLPMKCVMLSPEVPSCTIIWWLPFWMATALVGKSPWNPLCLSCFNLLHGFHPMLMKHPMTFPMNWWGLWQPFPMVRKIKPPGNSSPADTLEEIPTSWELLVTSFTSRNNGQFSWDKLVIYQLQDFPPIQHEHGGLVPWEAHPSKEIGTIDETSIASGKLTVRYWTWPIDIVDLPTLKWWLLNGFIVFSLINQPFWGSSS